INEDTKLEKTNEARELAVKDAKNKAEGLAKAAGIALGKVINISENQSTSNSMRTMAIPAAGGGEDLQKNVALPNVQPGQTDISVTVSLSYEVR
ncbi:MAG: SIMPL domain-containing protein, partial [Bacteroidales bacterium]|nr:SIMPL domain-containing protein [Bacteroidales bacterium]